MDMLAPSGSPTLETLRFLTASQIASVTEQFGTPVYIYDQTALISQAKSALNLPLPCGLTVRYAMKANPIAAILKTFAALGIKIDASSGPEVHRAIKAGYEPSDIMLVLW